MRTWFHLAEQGSLGRGQSLRDRATIVMRGEPAKLCYFLSEGAAEIFHNSALGFSVVVKVVTAPTILSSPELLVGEPAYLASVRVAKNAKVHRMTRPQFLEILRSNPIANLETTMDIGIAFTGAARFEPSRLHDTETLLATLLSAYTDVFGSSEPRGVRILLRRSQADLAEAIGASERSVNRVLTRWKKLGILSKHGGTYLIHHPPKLIDLADELAGSLVHRWREIDGGPRA